MKCKVCAEHSPATLCNVCFLEELTEAIETGEEDPSKILQRIANKHGRLKGLKHLPIYKEVFGKKHYRIRRVVTTQKTGERCRIVPTYDGLLAITTGEGGQSDLGGRVVTLYEGNIPISSYTTETALIAKRGRGSKSKKYITSGPPREHLGSPSSLE